MRSHDQQVCGPAASKCMGRRAHEYHSRVGTAWRSPLDRQYNPEWGMSFIIGSHHYKCPDCGTVIRVDEQEWAVCENPRCSTIHNDIIADQKHEEYIENGRKISMARFAKSMRF